jgi:diguanylate cyclase (GGDEF)-like protein
VLLADTTQEETEVIAERLRAAVPSAAFPGQERQPGGHVTISVGVAMAAGGEPDEVVAAADHALYEAKGSGRNRVVLAAA